MLTIGNTAMWLMTDDGKLVNLDRVAVIRIEDYGDPHRFFVVADVQVTQSDEHGISPFLLRGAKWQCEDFITHLYDEIAAGKRIVSATDYLNGLLAGDE